MSSDRTDREKPSPGDDMGRLYSKQIQRLSLNTTIENLSPRKDATTKPKGSSIFIGRQRNIKISSTGESMNDDNQRFVQYLQGCNVTERRRYLTKVVTQ